jgi:NitT/TauT family transport system permease protein
MAVQDVTVQQPRSGAWSSDTTARFVRRALPVAVVAVLLLAAWYVSAAYFNLQYLSVHMRDVDPAGWQRMSLAAKLRESLTTPQPTMPTPAQTFGDFVTRLRGNSQGSLWTDLAWTGRAAVLGFLLGTLVGIVLGMALMSSRVLSQSLLPYIVASQTIPIVALVPAIMVAIGLGLRSEVLISAYLAFFSITISTYKGLQSVQPLALELMRSYAANPLQVFWKLRLPAALPFIFTGLKIGVTASLVGAIIAELPSGSAHGLGQSLVAASQYSANIQLWSTMLGAALLGLALYALVVIAERLAIRWRVEEQ